ncbi:MAG: CtsR family transcriptional regulator [Clostridia bacterium]|jgi:transcriptional regulator CtsR|nr:CtsR family transcriptional regulator [Clostridia bacterium]MBQ3927503.1 CtsR family transcriptional regulator [Clostridia bacterium]MBQ7728512.1 CtsR family transcriptional regulator [Clostridia bacterium]
MLTDVISKMIEEMLNESDDGSIELQRNDLAQQLGCVPSQISYVITSRFTPQRGYLIESRRGGGGCIRIVRKQVHRDEYLMHFYCAIGDEIDEGESVAFCKNLAGTGIIDEKSYWIMKEAMSNASLSSVPPNLRNKVRSDMFKQMLLTLMKS